VTSEMHRQPDWVWTVWLGFRRPKVWHKAGGLQIWQSSLPRCRQTFPYRIMEGLPVIRPGPGCWGCERNRLVTSIISLDARTHDTPICRLNARPC